MLMENEKGPVMHADTRPSGNYMTSYEVYCIS
jgi:hypothetical protein